VERSLRFQSRREVIQQLAPQYRQAFPSQNGSCSAAPLDAINRCKSARESRGMQKIRAYLLQSVEEHWQTEVIRGSSPLPVSAEVHRNIPTAAN